MVYKKTNPDNKPLPSSSEKTCMCMQIINYLTSALLPWKRIPQSILPQYHNLKFYFMGMNTSSFINNNLFITLVELDSCGHYRQSGCSPQSVERL